MPISLQILRISSSTLLTGPQFPLVNAKPVAPPPMSSLTVWGNQT